MDEACEFFFMGAQQALDTVVLPADPSDFKLLDIKKFDRSRWFEGVSVVSEPNHEPRRGRFMNNASDPVCSASDNGLLEILGHGGPSHQIAS
jgi:hypothetical protein